MTDFYHTFSMSRLSEALIESVSCHLQSAKIQKKTHSSPINPPL